MGKNNCIAAMVAVGTGRGVSVAASVVGVSDGSARATSGVGDGLGAGAVIKELGGWIVDTDTNGAVTGVQATSKIANKRDRILVTGFMVKVWRWDAPSASVWVWVNYTRAESGWACEWVE